MDALVDFQLLFTAACVGESETLPFFATHKAIYVEDMAASSASTVQDRADTHPSMSCESLHADAVSLRGSTIEIDTNLVTNAVWTRSAVQGETRP